jgi:hypothetical protein
LDFFSALIEARNANLGGYLVYDPLTGLLLRLAFSVMRASPIYVLNKI